MERMSKLDSLGVWIAAAAVAMFATIAANSAVAASITGTKHNLSSTSNTVHQTTTTEICVFCHTPHGGDTGKDAPLWNRGATATATFSIYDGLWGSRPSTFDGAGEGLQPVGSISALCLSCHDGATALDLMINKPGSGGFNSAGASAGYTWVGVTGTNQMPNAAITSIGSDLKNDHPIGVPYCGGRAGGTTGPVDTANCKDKDFNVATTSVAGGMTGLFWVDNSVGTAGVREKTDMILYVRTFGTSGAWPSVECGSCHDPHNADNPTFLRIANTGSQLCLTCHNK